MTYDQFIEVYSTLIRGLSQREQMQVLVLSDHHYTAQVRRAIPAIEPAIARIQAAIQPIVVERKLRWGDLEQALGAGGRREEMITWDGVHMTAEAHERVAAMLLPTLLEFATSA
jgi:lysophospholipase L1-like esterase